MPAETGQRVASYFIMQLLYLPFYVLYYVGYMSLFTGGSGYAFIFLAPLGMLTLGLYQWYAQAVNGQTTGQRLAGYSVVDEHTLQPIGWGRSFLRQFTMALIGSLTCGIGLIVMLVVSASDPRRQGWHDKAARSIPVTTASLVARNPVGTRAVTPAPPMKPSGPPPPLGPPRAFARTVSPPPPPPAPAIPPPPPPTAPSVSPPVSAAPVSGRLISGVPGFSVPTQSAETGLQPAVQSAPPPPPHDDLAHSATRALPRRQKTGESKYQLSIADGPSIGLEQSVLVGRDPAPRDGAESDRLLKVADPGLSLSKTHAAFGVDQESGPWVEDLNSTNGVLIVRAGEEIEVVTGDRTSLQEGDTVLLGDREVAISKGPQ